MRPWSTGPSGERGTTTARRVSRPPDGPGQRGPEKAGTPGPWAGSVVNAYLVRHRGAKDPPT